MKTASAVSYENASGIFMRRPWCEMHQCCFHKGGMCPPGLICVLPPWIEKCLCTLEHAFGTIIPWLDPAGIT